MAQINLDLLKKEIEEIESRMLSPDFWKDKDRAQADIKRLQVVKDQLAGFGKYDKGDANVTIFAGAGGDDAEDFVTMLFGMYQKFCNNRGWQVFIQQETTNNLGGYRYITFTVAGKNAYGDLKQEAGVHRLVRLSPFNAQSKRHTSFAMVEVWPSVSADEVIEIPESDLRVEFAKSSGPGGQNVNKRETAVRVVHIPTGLVTFSDSERSQERNREKALGYLYGKLARIKEEADEQTEAEFRVSKTTENEWGSQIRSYVLHPYQMIKDHRTGFEERNIDKVLKDGGLEGFIQATKEKSP